MELVSRSTLNSIVTWPAMKRDNEKKYQYIMYAHQWSLWGILWLHIIYYIYTGLKFSTWKQNRFHVFARVAQINGMDIDMLAINILWPNGYACLSVDIIQSYTCILHICIRHVCIYHDTTGVIIIIDGVHKSVHRASYENGNARQLNVEKMIISIHYYVYTIDGNTVCR